MRARDKTGKIVEIWQISRKGPQPTWVKEAFAKNYLVWIDNHLLSNDLVTFRKLFWGEYFPISYIYDIAWKTQHIHRIT